MRYVFKRLSEAFEILIRPDRYLRLDDELVLALQELVADSRVKCWTSVDKDKPISPRRVAAEVIQFGMEYHWTSEANAHAWDQLTPREQHVAALVCLGYANKEIARKMMISTSTVKTHIRNILRKFGLNGKLELKGVLREWDFSAWENIVAE